MRAAAEAVAAAAPVVRAVDASYRARDYRSFEFVSCDVAPGTVHALLTVRGTDARDFLLAVAGLVRCTGGSIEVAGEKIGRGGRRAPSAQVRCGLFPGLNDPAPDLSVESVLASELALAGRACGTEVVLDLARTFLLATHIDMAVGRLDPASRLRLGAALAVAWEPAVVVVDGASGAVPHEEALRLMRVLGAYAREHGTAFLLSTTSPALARAADERTFMDLDARELFSRAEGGDR